ncbi:MAG TPA: endolytic transglycosylase MltG [Clostridiales bacterium]|nr:endolytic transglycosylase MltG [Clostridiales bacterium]
MSGGIRKPGAVQNKRKTANQGTQNAASARGARNTNRSVSGGGIPKPGAARGGKKDGRALNGKARKMNKRYKVPLTILFVVFLVVIVFMSSFLSYTYLVDKYANPVSAESIALDEETSVKFRIDKGMSTRDIAEQLYDLGLIQNKTIYRFLSKFNGFDGQYKVGTYTLCEGLSYDEIMTLLAGEPETVRVTFPEGFTTEQIAARLEANNVVTADEFLAALETIDVSSYPFLSELAGTARDHRLDGYLFPDTYEFDVKANVEDVIYKMLNRFNELYLPAYYEKSETIGLTTDQVVILASIVEREAKLQSERPIIAGVFMNRLHSDDPSLKKLQSCATIRYIYKKLYNEDVIDITEEHERVEDPYNTYLYDGLPPGPICSPGIESIKAVLNYEESDYYFFVLNVKDGVGSHIFSKTYQEHLEAQNQYG